MRERKGSSAWRWTGTVPVCTLLVAMGLMGCSRLDYRYWADRDVYGIERERSTDRRWATPFRLVEADSRSRMADPGDPDAYPIPLDDPEARKWQVSGAFPFEFHGWKKRGATPVEDLTWMVKLPKQPDGSVLLTRDSAMELGVMHSRDYQFQVENVYLAALSLTLARWQYAVQFFAGQRTFFQHLGGVRNSNNQLQLNTSDGFTKTFASGAQLLVDFTNALVFEFNGKSVNTSNSSLLVSLTQPLLRNAFARIQTQPLSLQERQTLYAIRDFAHYRRVFYLTIVGSSGYLGLLSALQGIRNQENTLESQKRNLELYDELVAAGFATAFQRDQFAQNVQQTEINLVNARASLQTQLDSFKINLGLPPNLLLKLDDSPLKNFELNDPRLDALRLRNDTVYLSLLQDQVVPRPTLVAALDTVVDEFKQLDEVLDKANEELGKWRERLANPDPQMLEDAQDRQLKLAIQLKRILSDCRLELSKNRTTADELKKVLAMLPPEEAQKRVLDLVGKEFRARFTEVFTSQTQTRVFLIELPKVDLTLEDSISIALANRLDLMNNKARVTDAWRQVEVTANHLRGGLDLQYTGNLNTDPKHDNIFRFDPAHSTHRIGIAFDAPVNRLAERNDYRSAQITYQRARRAYMANYDLVLQQIRLDLRQLDASRRSFDISREAFITLSRQVEDAEYQVRTSRDNNATSDVTLLLSQALNNLLQAKNSLIGTWVTYETQRMSLFRDFDLMDIDAHGVWTNEHADPSQFPRSLPPGGFGAAVDDLGGFAPLPEVDTPPPPGPVR